jgi:peroxiredoxin
MSTNTTGLTVILALLTAVPAVLAQAADAPQDAAQAAPGQPNLKWQKFPAEFADYYMTQRIPASSAEPQPFCKSARPIQVGPHPTLFTTGAILDESGGTGTGYDTLYVDVNNTGDFSNAQVYKISPQERKTGLEGHSLLGYFENVQIPRGWDSVHGPGSAHVQMFVEQNPDRIEGSDYLVNMIPAQWAVGTIQINGQPTPVAMVDGTFNDSAVNRIGMRQGYLDQMSPGEDAGVVRSDYLIIGQPGQTSLQPPADPNTWLGKTGSARSMNVPYLVLDAGLFEIQATQVAEGVDLQLVPANVPTSTVDVSQFPHDGSRLAMFGTNACVILDNPGSTVQVPADTYYVPAFGQEVLSAPAGETVTLAPPAGFVASAPQGTDVVADRGQRIFTAMEPPAGESGTTDAVRWSQPSADPYAFAAARPGWRIFKLVVVDADTRQAVPKANVSVRCYTGGRSGGGGSRKATTDAAGTCAIPMPGGDLQYLSATVDAAGYVPAQMFWSPRGGAAAIPDQYTWLLEKATTIGGVVRDEHGRPIRGVEVTLQIGERNYFATDKPQVDLSRLQITTDSRGRWQCKFVPAKLGQVLVGLRHPDFISDQRPARPVKAEDLRNETCELVMKPGITLTGKVTDPKGRPVENAAVTCRSYQSGISTDRQGRFKIPGLAPGETTVTVHAAGFAPESKKITIEQDMRTVDFKLKAGVTLKGRVIDAAGNGIAMAQVYLQFWKDGTFWWNTMTDAQGRFTWAEAPDEELALSVQAEGYNYKSDWRVRPGPEEQVITLKGQIQVTGRVIDAATGAPIPSFTAVPGIFWGPSPFPYWSRYESAAGKDGAFKLSLRQEGQRYQVRIEAPGYKPGVCGTFTETEAGQPLEFALERGQGPSGIVLGVDGQPLPDAKVLVGTQGQPAYLVNGRTHPGMAAPITSGPDGRFTLMPETDPYTVVAVHDTGVVQVSQKDFEKNTEIRLQPWGRIEGTVRKGDAPVADEQVFVMTRESDPGRSAVSSYGQYTTDGEGRFLAERVLPGEATVNRQVGQAQRNSFAREQRVTVKPGETVKVTLGGPGRTLTGRFSPPIGTSRKIDWQRCAFLVQPERKAPKVPASVASKDPEAIRHWYKAWLTTDEGQASHLADQPAYCRVQDDGTFQVEDVPAGNYQLCACVYDRGDEADRSIRPLGNAVQEVKVPADGASTAAIDLGLIELKPVTPLKTGQPAPGFEVKTFDGKTLRLSDHRGKYVVLTFWAGWFSQSPQETLVLSNLQKQYRKDDRFVMIGLNLDPKIEDARTYALVYDMPGLQGHLGDWTKSAPLREYGVAMLPSYTLIGPDGKVEANSPSFYSVNEALTKALGPGADPTKAADSQPATTQPVAGR